MAVSEREEGQDRLGRAALAYDRLRELIVHGQLAPGSRIIETEVAERLGVSRTPVRSALQRLQQEGFIVGGRDGERSRAAVAPLTRDDAGELFEIVGALEGLAAAHAARLAPDGRAGLLERLEKANRRLEDLEGKENPDRARYYDLDSAFHQVYVEAGAGGRLLSLHESVKPQAERYIRLYVSVLTGEIGTSVQEHRKIIEAIRIGAPDQAQEAVFRNWRNAAERLNRVIDSVGERGSW
jgi:DNA-binding GntR family transcriptional regulator